MNSYLPSSSTLPTQNHPSPVTPNIKVEEKDQREESIEPERLPTVNINSFTYSNFDLQLFELEKQELYQLLIQKDHLERMINQKRMKLASILKYDLPLPAPTQELGKRKIKQLDSLQTGDYEITMKKIVLAQELDPSSPNSLESVTKNLEPTHSTHPQGSPDSDREKNDSKKRISMSQNYKGSITRGFARWVVSRLKENDTEVINFMISNINEIKKDYQELENEESEKLKQLVTKYIRDNIQGKIAYQTKNDRSADNAKVGSNKQIQTVFFPSRLDEPIVVLQKKVSHKLLIYFLTSSYFEKWLNEDCHSTTENKVFLANNIEEIIKVFKDPQNYKPRFH
jgi:hypothetical protein